MRNWVGNLGLGSMMRHDLFGIKDIHVHWNGWSSTIQRLQAEGWKVAIEQDIAYQSMRIALSSQNGECYAITGIDRFVWQDLMDRTFDSHGGPPIHFSMEMQKNINLQCHGKAPNFIQGRFNDFTTVQQFTSKNLSEYFFSPLENTEKDVIVLPESVPELMDLILKKQAPTQQEIRERMQKKERRDNYANSIATDTQARIVTLKE